jgi:hypothetical protein
VLPTIGLYQKIYTPRGVWKNKSDGGCSRIGYLLAPTGYLKGEGGTYKTYERKINFGKNELERQKPVKVPRKNILPGGGQK